MIKFRFLTNVWANEAQSMFTLMLQTNGGMVKAGPPQPTPQHTSLLLQQMGMVGVYRYVAVGGTELPEDAQVVTFDTWAAAGEFFAQSEALIVQRPARSVHGPRYRAELRQAGPAAAD
jgi:hypothetical protein